MMVSSAFICRFARTRVNTGGSVAGGVSAPAEYDET
jgi:hypothetical protein